MKTIVSLFDGISCCYMALKKAEIQFDKYIASEVDKYAQKASQYNFPDIIRVGDVRNVKINEPVWLLAGGSPCQSFSFAGKMNGMSTKDSIDVVTLEQYLDLKEKGFEFEGQSYLFWEYVRILKETKPKYFFLENVEMPEKWEKLISKTLGVNPIKINSSLVSAQNRVRLYWTNIGLEPNGLFGDLQSIIPQPKDKGIFIKDILQDKVDEKYFLSKKLTDFFESHSEKHKNKGNGFVFKPKKESDKANCLRANGALAMTDNMIYQPKAVAMRGRGENNQQTLEPRSDYKRNSLTTVQKDNMVYLNYAIRRFTPVEVCRLQTISDNFFFDENGNNIISDSQIYKSVGNGWTVDVIAHIFSYLK